MPVQAALGGFNPPSVITLAPQRYAFFRISKNFFFFFAPKGGNVSGRLHTQAFHLHVPLHKVDIFQRLVSLCCEADGRCCYLLCRCRGKGIDDRDGRAVGVLCGKVGFELGNVGQAEIRQGIKPVQAIVIPSKSDSVRTETADVCVAAHSGKCVASEHPVHPRDCRGVLQGPFLIPVKHPNPDIPHQFALLEVERILVRSHAVELLVRVGGDLCCIIKQ